MNKVLKEILIPPVFVLISLILIILFYFIFPDLNFLVFPFNLLGIAVIILGFIIMGQAHDLFKKHKTTRTFDKSAHLIDEGIFRKTRNPMYIGMFLILIGVAACFGNLISLLVPFIFILIIRIVFIPFEEKIMLETFGDKYIDYKKHVGRWI